MLAKIKDHKSRLPDLISLRYSNLCLSPNSLIVKPFTVDLLTRNHLCMAKAG